MNRIYDYPMQANYAVGFKWSRQSRDAATATMTIAAQQFTTNA